MTSPGILTKSHFQSMNWLNVTDWGTSAFPWQLLSVIPVSRFPRGGCLKGAPGAPVGPQPSPAQLVPQGQQHLTPTPWPSPQPVSTHRARHPPLTSWSWRLWLTLTGIAAALGALRDAVRFGALRNTVHRAQPRSSAIPLCLGCSCSTQTLILEQNRENVQ